MNKDLVMRYMEVVDDISVKYNYDNNIKHLLYLIIPAFIVKYNNRSKLIVDTFMNIPIIKSNKDDKYVNAFYASIPEKSENDIITKKYIILNNYNKVSLITLLDSLVHEYNHAINSYLKEVSVKDQVIYVRTGLTYITYDMNTLKSIKKLPSYILEEVINTRQTEEIIDIIKNYNDTSIETINNTIYSINGETKHDYESKAYYLEAKILNKLLSNKTFIYTLENLRIEGNIEDIEKWFNDITGIKDSYNSLINNLNKIIELENKLINIKHFKSFTINKIKNLIDKVNNIINTFNKNCNYR